MNRAADLLPPGEPSDADVIARVLSGDANQFACLVRRYQRALYRLAVAIVLDHDAAADMVQDAFVRAYTNLRSCRDPSRFRPWLFQVLRNRCADHLKERRRRDVRLQDAGPLFDGAEDPGARAERTRMRSAIRRALARLPAVQREVFLMHYVDCLPYETVAQLLDVSVSAVKMRALRARDSLASTLRDASVTGGAADSSSVQIRAVEAENRTAEEEL